MAGEDEGRGFGEGAKRERERWRLETGSVATVIDLWLCGKNESGEESERASEPSLGWEQASETRNRKGEKGKGANVRRVQKLGEKEIKEIEKRERERTIVVGREPASSCWQLCLVRSMHALYPDSYRAKTETRRDKRDTRYRTRLLFPPRRRTGGPNTYLSSSAKKKLALFPAFRYGSPKEHVPAPVRLMMME